MNLRHPIYATSYHPSEGMGNGSVVHQKVMVSILMLLLLVLECVFLLDEAFFSRQKTHKGRKGKRVVRRKKEERLKFSRYG